MQLYKKWISPIPETSAFHSAEWGMVRFSIVNETHALSEWVRNVDSVKVVTDEVWIVNRPL
jgi:hypothetical protein